MQHDDYHRIATASALDIVAHDEDVAKDAQEGNRAYIAANHRVQTRYAKYVGRAATAAELDDRLDLIKGEVLSTVVEACTEHGYNTHDEVQTVLSKVVDELRKTAIPGHQNEGDSYTGESQSVDKDTQPKLDTSSNEGLEHVEVPSVRNPSERQDITEAPTDADLGKNPKDEARNDDTTKVIDADKPIGADGAVGDATQQFSGEGQANPVTSGVSAKWRLVDGQ